MDARHISQEQADEYAIGALEPDLERGIALHIAECSPCRHLVREAEQIAASISLAVPRRRAPPRLKERVYREAGIRPQSFVRRAIVLAPAAAAIAAVFVAIAAFTGMVSVRGQIQDLRDQNSDLASKVQQAQSQEVEILALSRRLSEEERASFDLKITSQMDRDLVLAMMSPDSQAADIFSTDPSGSGIARLIWDEKEKRVFFVATGLPPRPSGETYHVWVDSGGSFNSVGTFNSDAGGFARFDAELPEGVEGYERAVITIERAGVGERNGTAVFAADLSRFHN